jgi:ABC-2 type transport system permease protein
MRKTIEIINLFWSTSLAAELEYRWNFVIASLTSFLNLAGSIFSLFLFYRTGYHFANWSWPQAMLVLSFFILLQGISSTFFEPNLNRIVTQVQKGTLDYVLLKPISSQFWLSFRVISIWGLPDLLFAFLVMLYAGRQLHLAWQNYLLALLPILSSCLILYSIWFLLATTSIWFVKINNVTEVLRGFLQAGRYPVSAYPAMYRIFFTFVVPVAFLTTVPAQTILGRVSPELVIGSCLLAIVLPLVANFFWRYAMRFYTSASS